MEQDDRFSALLAARMAGYLGTVNSNMSVHILSAKIRTGKSVDRFLSIFMTMAKRCLVL